MISSDFSKRQAPRIAIGITMLVLFLAGPGMVQAETILSDKFQVPGQLEANGTHFELNNSEYLNITLNSSEPVKLVLESIPKIVTMHLESISGATSTQIIMSGFAPLTAYNKFEDNYHNRVTFTTDERGEYAYTQDLLNSHFVFFQPEPNKLYKASFFTIITTETIPSTVFIKDNATGGDCVLIGTWDSGTKTCTLTTNLTSTIQIDNNSITLNGNGHTITNVGYGVYLSGWNGVTIENMAISGSSAAIWILSSNNNVLKNNNGFSNIYDIGLAYSVNNTITDNYASSNDWGIRLYSSNNNTVIGNNVSGNKRSIWLYLSENNLISSNKVPGNWFNADSINLQYSNYNEIINNTANPDINNNLDMRGMFLYNSNKNIINSNALLNNLYGVLLESSNNNTIFDNYFNNTINVQDDGNNSLNLTKTLGTNILAGPYLGGNFWAYPNSTGFSQTCADNNKDGICDFQYDLDDFNTDFLPLAAFSGPPGYGYISGTVLDNGTSIAGALVTANTSLSNTTDASGSFSFLVATDTYDLTVAREPEYYGNSSVVVNATSGSIAAQDIKLTRKPTGNITGTVKISTPGSSIADLNGDGFVDILDLGLVSNQIQHG